MCCLSHYFGLGLVKTICGPSAAARIEVGGPSAAARIEVEGRALRLGMR